MRLMGQSPCSRRWRNRRGWIVTTGIVTLCGYHIVGHAFHEAGYDALLVDGLWLYFFPSASASLRRRGRSDLRYRHIGETA
ncbi:hypothetical protein M2311_003119 [Rhizobium leguminosarum]|jgi:hypothetical protein|nr:hypothetical protein [Rhizobium leguminosarum]MDH6273032.1 hypothetical protein [Rhizobium leguminosarum]